MSELSLSLDVSEDVALVGRLVVAVDVHLPPTWPARAILICLPGGSYTKNYWAFGTKGRSGYNFAEYMAQAGYLVAALDHLGTGGSSKPTEGDQLTLAEVSAANASVVRQIRDGIHDGTLIDGYGPGGSPRVVGIGHSLGGCLGILQQAQYRSYDALVLLGYTPRFNNPVLEPDELDELRDPQRSLQDRMRRVCEILADRTPEIRAGPYHWMDRSVHRKWFYGSEVPADVIEADEMHATPFPRMVLVHASIPGVVTAEAAALDVPLFLGFGSEDLTNEPRVEVSAFETANDITLFVLPRSGHCHNFAPTRADLWRRIAGWIGDRV